MATQRPAAAGEKGDGAKASLLQKISGMVAVSKQTNADAQKHYAVAKEAKDALEAKAAEARSAYAHACLAPHVAAPEWWSWHADGRPLGPVRLPQLLYLCRGRGELDLDALVSFGDTPPATLRWYLYQYPQLVQAWEECQTSANKLPAARKRAAAASEKAEGTGKQLAAVEAAYRTAQLDAAMWAWTDEETGTLGAAHSLTNIQTLIANGDLKASQELYCVEGCGIPKPAEAVVQERATALAAAQRLGQEAAGGAKAASPDSRDPPVLAANVACWGWMDSADEMQGPFSMKDMRAWLRSGYLKDTNWVAHVDKPSQEWMLKDVLAAQRVYPEAWLSDPGAPQIVNLSTRIRERLSEAMQTELRRLVLSTLDAQVTAWKASPAARESALAPRIQPPKPIPKTKPSPQPQPPSLPLPASSAPPHGLLADGVHVGSAATAASAPMLPQGARGMHLHKIPSAGASAVTASPVSGIEQRKGRDPQTNLSAISEARANRRGNRWGPVPEQALPAKALDQDVAQCHPAAATASTQATDAIQLSEPAGASHSRSISPKINPLEPVVSHVGVGDAPQDDARAGSPLDITSDHPAREVAALPSASDCDVVKSSPGSQVVPGLDSPTNASSAQEEQSSVQCPVVADLSPAQSLDMGQVEHIPEATPAISNPRPSDAAVAAVEAGPMLITHDAAAPASAGNYDNVEPGAAELELTPGLAPPGLEVGAPEQQAAETCKPAASSPQLRPAEVQTMLDIRPDEDEGHNAEPSSEQQLQQIASGLVAGGSAEMGKPGSAEDPAGSQSNSPQDHGHRQAPVRETADSTPMDNVSNEPSANGHCSAVEDDAGPEVLLQRSGGSAELAQTQDLENQSAAQGIHLAAEAKSGLPSEADTFHGRTEALDGSPDAAAASAAAPDLYLHGLLRFPADCHRLRKQLSSPRAKLTSRLPRSRSSSPASPQGHTSPQRQRKRQSNLAAPAVTLSDTSSDPDAYLDIPLGLRRRSAGPLRKISSSKSAAAQKSKAQHPIFTQLPAAPSAAASESAASRDDLEATADQSGLESRTHPSATPSDIGSEQSNALESPHRLHPQSAAAAAEEAARSLLISEQDLSIGAETGTDGKQGFDPFAAEDIVVPISERVKRAKRKPPAPAYASLVDDPLPSKKKKKKKMKLLLQQHELHGAGGGDGACSPAAFANAPYGTAAANGYPLGHLGPDEQHRMGSMPAQHALLGNADIAAKPSAPQGLQSAGPAAPPRTALQAARAAARPKATTAMPGRKPKRKASASALAPPEQLLSECGCARAASREAVVICMKAEADALQAAARVAASSASASRTWLEAVPAEEVKTLRVGAGGAERASRHSVREAVRDEGSADTSRWKHLKGRTKDLKFGRSHVHAWGLFAMETIEPGDFVIEYVGELIRLKLSDAREAEYEASGLGSSYLFRIDHEWVVDATKKGGFARFINHSCDPNCHTKIIIVDGIKHIAIYAKRVIEPNEELFYDYKFEREPDKDAVPCSCGARNCRRRLN
ncbi:hypothetical protein WJX74_010862 [Apatococcus lobatus]|uniref:[histone H3]-lysine(4) N-trimethyltransferase n=1 Tax=Apatococcus lobatus TaxID=904363 RepID=A0AAW1RWA7_9CHLO